MFFSHASIINERQRHLKSYWYIIHPFSSFTKYWQIFMVFVWLFILANDVFQMTFRAALVYEGYNVVTWSYTVFVSTVLLLVDILITTMTGYFDEKIKEVILKPSKIVLHYLQTWFIVDSFTLMVIIRWILGPYGLTSNITVNKILSLLRFIRMLKIYYIIVNVRWITNACKLTYPQYLLICLILVSTYILHFNACMYCLIPNSLKQIDPKNKASKFSWIMVLARQYKKQSRHMYCLSLYAHSLLECLLKFNIGTQGLIMPLSYQEKLLNVIFMFMGFILKALFFLVFYHIIEMSYSSSINFSMHENMLNIFLKTKSLPKILKKQIIKYYRHTNHVMTKKVISDLSPALRLDILTQLWRTEIENSILLKKIPAGILEKLISRFELDVYITNTTVYKCGNTADCLYFLCSGSVAIYDENGTEKRHVFDSSYLGTNSADFSIETPLYRYTAVTLEYCEFLILTRENLKYFSKQSPIFLILLQQLRSDEVNLKSTRHSFFRNITIADA